MSGVPIRLNALQACRIHGWANQLNGSMTTLDWADIVKSLENEKGSNMTWKRLRGADCNLKAEQLKTLQPDKNQWINRGLVTLSDVPDMTLFPVNPLIDMNIDLAELWRMMSLHHCSCKDLIDMQITFEQLIAKGLTAELMFYFNFTLAEWQSLGMTAKHISKMSESECLNIFALGKQETIDILQKFQTPSQFSDSLTSPLSF